jgi:hypothetical protein
MTRQQKHLRHSKHGKTFVAGTRQVQEMDEEKNEANVLDGKIEQEEDSEILDAGSESLKEDDVVQVEIPETVDGLEIKFIEHSDEDE